MLTCLVQVLAENGICCWVAMQILGNNLDVMSSPTAKLTMKRRSVVPCCHHLLPDAGAVL